MIAGSLARRYARALFDIGAQQGTFDQLGNEVEELARAYAGSRDLQEALTNPIFPRAKRRAVLEAVVQRAAASPVTRNFALLLLDRERVPYLPAIARELRAMVDEKAGRVRAEVTSARPLEPAHAVRIASSLQKLTGAKHVVLDKREDPELLGGIVTKIGDVVYDGSVRTQLEQMRERFLSTD